MSSHCLTNSRCLHKLSASFHFTNLKFSGVLQALTAVQAHAMVAALSGLGFLVAGAFEHFDANGDQRLDEEEASMWDVYWRNDLK